MDTTSALSFSLTVPSTKFHYSPLIFAFQQLSTNQLFESSTILPILDIIFSPSYFSSHNYGTITISLITDYSKKKKGSLSRKRTLSYKWKRSKKKKNLPTDLRRGIPLFPINSTSSPLRVTATVSIPSASTGAVVINFHRLGQSQGQIIYSATAAIHPLPRRVYPARCLANCYADWSNTSRQLPRQFPPILSWIKLTDSSWPVNNYVFNVDERGNPALITMPDN